MLAERVPIALRMLGYSISPSRAGSSALPPDTAATNTPADPAATATTQQPIVATEYTVVAGDYLVGIATRANTTVDSLVKANTWPDGINHRLVLGDLIKLR